MTAINLVFESSPRWVLAEHLSYELYRRAGMKIQQSGHARVTMDGRTFRRFLARDAAAGTARVAVASAGPDRRTVYFTTVVLALGLLMLLALGRSMRLRPSPVPVGWNGDLGPTPEELARRIAALDASFQRRRAPSVEERQEYERLRGGLKAQLTDAIARHGGSGDEA